MNSKWALNAHINRAVRAMQLYSTFWVCRIIVSAGETDRFYFYDGKTNVNVWAWLHSNIHEQHKHNYVYISPYIIVNIQYK